MNTLFFDFEQLKQAYWNEPRPSLATRKDRILRLVTMLNENEENICKVIQADFGFRNIIETQLAELTTIRQAASLAVKNLEMWTKPVHIKTPIHLWPSKSELLPEPKGIVGIMSPWNYPLSLALSPAIAAIAAGNQVWLKPSERSPRTSGYLAKLIAQYFNPIEISIITGNQQVAQAFADLPFDHLFFTGSTRVGQLVAQAAAANLTPVTLELGGKSPVIIDQSAALDDAARRIIYGKFFNAGQTCIAPDYLLVPRNQEKPLIEALKKSLQIMYPSGSGLTHPIDALQLKRWQNLLTDASQSGGKVVPLYDTTPIDYPFIPSLVLNPSSKALVTTQEIFGPILPIICYDSMSEAIDWINHLPTPLALYWFGNNAKLRAEVLEKTQSGGVTCNDTLLHYSNPNLPFGGLGASGMGSNHGKHGFDTFSHLKPVLSMRGFLGIRALGGTRLAHPPYGKRIQRLMKILKTSKI